MELIKPLKAVSDETRLRILFLLLNYELNVNEIVAVIGMIQSGISRHLKILVESGLLSSRRDGSYIYYSAVRNDRMSGLIDAIRQGISTEKQVKRDLQHAEQVINERDKRTRRFFKHVAPQWDVLKRQVLGDLDLNRLIADQVASCRSVADLGCGTGEMLAMLEEPSIYRRIGVDSSVEMLDLARRRLINDRTVDLRLGELEHLPMKNQEVGCVIMNMVLHHISMPGKVIQEVGRVIEKDGVFILTDFQKHDKENIRKIIGGAWLGFTAEKVEQWLASAGFFCRSTQSVLVQHGLIVNIYLSNKAQ